MAANDGERQRELLYDRQHQRTQQADAGTDRAEIMGNTRPIRLRGRTSAIGLSGRVKFRGRDGCCRRRRRGKPFRMHMAERHGHMHGKRRER